MRQRGFTLLEVMIAMSILAVGATSILSVFVAAISFHTKRVEENRITEIYNHVRQHAEIAFETFDPTRLKPGEKQLPKPIVADLNDPAAETSADRMVAEAARKFPGFKYEIRFEENRWAVSGSSVVASITIHRLSGEEKDAFRSKEFLTRSGTPTHEFWTSPSREQRDRARLDPSRRGGG
jgi:prepilin-type N-terminal cleavage/methylation domain-containing protein